EHTEYEQDSVYGKLNYELGDTSRLNFAYSYDEGRNADPVSNYPDFWDDIYRRRTYQRLLFETSPTESLDLALEGRHHRFYSWIDDVYSDHREIYYDYIDETWGLSARMNYDISDANRFTLGFDEDWGRYHWVSEVENVDLEGKTRNWATYANDTFTVGNFSFNAGIRYDDNSDFGSEFSPSGGLVYRIPSYNALVRTQVAKGYSAPRADWVHLPVVGNPDLGPEKSLNYQLGGEVHPVKFLRLELNLFRADITDFIRWNEDAEKYENIAEVTRQGIEGSVSANFDFGLTLSFSGSYVDVRDEQTNEVIKDIPRRLYNLSASYTHKQMAHSVVGKYVYNYSSYPETRDKVFIFDYLLKASLPFLEQYGKPTLFGAVHNLTNSTYIYRYVFPKPDRWFEGGVRFEF
ncbi:MAG: TonB-dependent receptor, partial [Desulfobacterales bacterium]|nr:TonB-dependent receptor [Desulfobacterales bacterium]